MEDEVKITIIATGFSTDDSVITKDDDDQHISQLIMSVVNDETQLDVPPFLRRQYAPRRRTGTY